MQDEVASEKAVVFGLVVAPDDGKGGEDVVGVLARQAIEVEVVALFGGWRIEDMALRPAQDEW